MILTVWFAKGLVGIFFVLYSTFAITIISWVFILILVLVVVLSNFQGKHFCFMDSVAHKLQIS